MYYRVKYTETLSYEEWVEASCKDEASTKFVQELESGSLIPDEAEVGEYEILETSEINIKEEMSL